jgi:D-sedoheptulose 7-phosphate isomerase
MPDDRDIALTALADTIALHQAAADRIEPVLEAARAMTAAIQGGGKLLLFGNGGSAADAQHASAELVGRFLRERPGLPAMALTTDTSILTSVGNDYGFDRIFVRQVEALGRRGDVAVGISTSGRSPNVLAALEWARAHGLVTIALTGCDGGAVGRAAAIHLNVASDAIPRVQEVHRTILHVLCDLVDRALAPTPGDA